MHFVDLKSQYEAYRKEIKPALEEVLATCEFIGGRQVTAFEKELGWYVNPQSAGGGEAKKSYAVGCSSGTDALLLALLAAGVRAGAEVVTSPYTFIATAEAIMHLGARPVFADVAPDTYLLTAEQIEPKLTDKTAAIIPVSLFGETCEMNAINTLAKKRGLTVIEDAAQSLGAHYGRKRSGALSLLATTSFFPSKPLGGYGDGGAVFTTEKKLADKVRQLLNHGQRERYRHEIVGLNARLDALQAAVLRVKLRHLEEELVKRRKIALRYDTEIDQEKYRPQKRRQAGKESAYAHYSVTTPRRTVVLEKLQQHQIPFAVYYPLPLHLQQAFAGLGYKKGDFPVAETLCETMFSLPIHPFLKDEEVERVLKVLNNI